MRKAGHKIIAAMTVLAATLALLSSCGGEAETSSVRIMAGTAMSRSMAGDSLDMPEDEVFLRFMRMLTDTESVLTVETPKTRENAALAVEPEESLRTAVADVLQYAAFTKEEGGQPAPKTQEDRLVFSAEKRGGGTFSGLLTRRRNEDGKSDGVLRVYDDDVQIGSYVYAGGVYNSVLTLLETRYVNKNVRLDGQYAILRSKYNLAAIEEERGLIPGEFIQTKNGLLWYFTLGENTTSIVECFRGAGSRSAYTFSVNEPILRMEPYDKESGYDYRVVTAKGVRYGSSGSAKKEKIWRLPDSVQLMTVSEDITGSFDLFQSKIAYAATDGIYLANSDGSGKTLIASHGVLKNMLDPTNNTGYNYYFNDPRFLMNGSMVGLSVQSSGTGGEIIGFASVRLDTMEIKYYLGVKAASQKDVHYVSDFALVALSSTSANILDLDTGGQGSLALQNSDSRYFTVNGKQFVVSEPPVEDSKGVPITHTYLAEAESVNNGGELLLWTKGESFTPHAATQNYFIGFLRDARGLYPVAAYYKNTADEASAAPEEILPDVTVTPEEPDVTVEPLVDLTDVTVPLGPDQQPVSYPSIAGDWTWPTITDDGLLPENGVLPSSSVPVSSSSKASSIANPWKDVPMGQRDPTKMPTMPDPVMSSSQSSVGGRRFTAEAAAQLAQLQQLQNLNDLFGDSSSSTGIGMDTASWLSELYDLDMSSSGEIDYWALLESLS